LVLVAPPEQDEDFDFEQAILDIHVELVSLNDEAAARLSLSSLPGGATP
jgi:hypothetical protein